jgi:Rieske Fe-S protein
MANSASTTDEHPEPPSRRDFLYIATGRVGAVGVAAAMVSLVDQMNPDASTLAAGGPLDLDVSNVVHSISPSTSSRSIVTSFMASTHGS